MVPLGGVLLAPFADNANIIGWCAAEAEASRASLQHQLSRMGLAFRIEVECESSVQSVGLWLDEVRRRVRNTPERSWRLHRALTGLPGHMVNFAMVERVALSVLDELWRLVDRCGHEVEVFNP